MSDNHRPSPKSDLSDQESSDSKMSEQGVSESQQRDRAVQENEAVDPRAARIWEYICDSLNKVDSLEATVGAASGDLMFIQHLLQQVLAKTLAESPDSLTVVTEVMPAMNTCLKVSKQIEGNLHLILKLKKAGKDAC